MKRALDYGWDWVIDPYRMQKFDENDMKKLFCKNVKYLSIKMVL